MKKLSHTKKNLLYALLGNILFWQMPMVSAASEAATDQIASEQNPMTSTKEQSEFSLDGVEVIANKITTGTERIAKYSTIGTKLEAALSDTPQSISIITREQMDARGVTDLAQALSYSAGITASPWGNDTRWNWSLVRGFSVGYEGTGVDGLRLSTNSYALWDFEPYGMESLEILRGPASTLYGGSSPGGLFNWVSKQPTAEALREVRIQGGTDHYRSAALDLGGQAGGQENLTFRLTALSRDRDFAAAYSNSQRNFIAPSLAWKISDDTNITFQAHYLKDALDGSDDRYVYHPGDSLYGISDKIYLGIPGWGGYTRKQYYYGYLLDHKVNDTWTLHNKFRYGHVGTVYNMNWATLQNDGHTVALGPLEVYDYTADSYTMDTYGEAKWQSGIVSHHTVIGVDYRKGNLKQRYGYADTDASLDLDNLQYNSLPLTFPETALNYQATIKQTGFYAQDQLKLGDKWTTLLGGRQDHYDRNAMNPQTGERIRHKANQFSGRAGLVYHAGHGLSPYLSYTEAFEPVEGQDRYGKNFDPSSSRQYELGIQYEPKHRNARFTASLFDLRKQNVLTPDPLNTSTEWYEVQVGEVKSKGLELEANMAAFKGLNLTASYTLLDAKTTKSSTASDIGLRPQSVSRHNATLWLDTSLPGKTAKGLGFGAGLRYIGSRYNYDNTVKLGDVLLTDAQLCYDVADWHYALNIRNVFNKQYESTYSYAGEDRTVLLTATHRW